MNSSDSVPSDLELAVRFAKLWPRREHEASILELLCHAGLHRWRRLDLTELAPGKDIAHCFRCSKVRINGEIYDV